jgi:hypothetical protein
LNHLVSTTKTSPMATVQRTTKNSLKNNRESFNNSSTTPKNNTSGRQPVTVAQQYAALDAKITQILVTNTNLETQVGSLLEKVAALEAQNWALKTDNTVLRSNNNALSAKLIAVEVRLSSVEGDIETTKQKSLKNTVEILEAPAEAAENALAFVKEYAQEIGCSIKESDLNNYYSSTHTRNNTTKTKIVLEFASLKKRKDFYFAGREHRFYKDQQKNQQPRKFRSIKVVDALTQYKKNIFFNIIDNRKINKDVVKNVWISDGEIFVRRFGSTAAEPVKNQAFVDLLFPNRREDEEGDENEDEDDDDGDV